MTIYNNSGIIHNVYGVKELSFKDAPMGGAQFTPKKSVYIKHKKNRKKK